MGNLCKSDSKSLKNHEFGEAPHPTSYKKRTIKPHLDTFEDLQAKAISLDIDELKEENQLLIKIKALENQIQNLEQKLLRLPRRQEIDLQKVPFCSIRLKPLFALSSDGWPVKLNLPEQIGALQERPIPIVSVLGICGAGKSWLANKLSGGLLPFGREEKDSNNLTLRYVDQGSGFLAFLEAKGYDESFQANHESFVSTLPIDSGNLMMISEADKYQLLLDSSIFIEDLKLEYVAKNSGLIIIVVGIFNANDMQIIHKLTQLIASHHEGRPSPQVLIVHNYSWLTEKDAVKVEIDILSNVFEQNKEPLFTFNTGSDSLEDKNKSYLKDKSGVTHLILAAEKSEAGEYYNHGTIEFVLSKLRVLELKKKLNFVQSFVDFCNQKVSEAFGPQINLKYEQEQQRIIDSQKVKLDPLQVAAYNISRNVYAPETFKPRYSKITEELAEGRKLVTVVLEMLDSNVTSKKLSLSRGWYYLVLTGEKEEKHEGKREIPGNSVEYSKGTREFGPFKLVVQLVQGMKEESVETDETVNGIMKIRVYFKQEELEF